MTRKEREDAALWWTFGMATGCTGTILVAWACLSWLV
jgi:hypothetical protein